MKVLMMFHWAPNAPPLDMGPAKRNFPFFAENLKRHEVSVLSLGSAEEEERFRGRFGAQCQNVRFVRPQQGRWRRLARRLWFFVTGKSTVEFLFHHRAMQRELDSLCAREKFDVIHCTTTHLGFYNFPEGVSLLGDTHNVDYDLLYRTFQQTHNLFWKLYYFLEYKRCRRDELRNSRRFHVVTATTDRDRDIFRKELPGVEVETIQNGVDERFFDTIDAALEPHTMLFLGLMSYLPNRNGILFFLDKVFPHILKDVPDARVYVVGANPSADVCVRAADNVVVTGFVEDVRPYIARSAVFVIPLLIGGGIRGKALEAMAMKCPIVTTHLGCEGIHLADGESALFADSPEMFADAVVRVMREPALRQSLTTRAYANVLEHYRWTAKGEELDRAYHRALEVAHGENR